MALSLARALAKRADEIAPPATDADLLTAFADPIDVVGFARRILGMMPWSRQREIFEALQEWKRIGVVSGHKTGKSTALAIIALWFYCSFPNARVVITATSDRQVNGIIWREIRRLVKGALVPIPGAARMGLRAATGLTHPVTFSEIRGYTGDKTEAIAGTSGSYVLYLVDEASGVEQPIFDAIEGNRAGGNAWVFLISNPTKADGEFYAAFHSQSCKALGSAGYFNIRISSEESPNVTGEWAKLEEYDRASGTWRPRTKPIPGLADPSWLAEKRIAWGEDSAQWKIRVAGLFCVAEEAKCFSADLLIIMQDRWEDTEGNGRLWIGVDPAGDGDGGDESGFASRAGPKVYELRARRGLSPAQHIDTIRDMIAAAAAAGAKLTLRPCVNVESEGEAGWRVYVAIREYAERTGEFEVCRVRTSEKAIRMPLLYDKVRDEMWAIARLWGREGGAIPTNDKLFDDLHAPEFASDLRGRLKLTPKKDLRKTLGRSPDSGDALVISCWEPIAMLQEETAASGQAPPGGFDVYDAEAPNGGELNPYGGISPYG
jgi:hypothetical protein